MCLGEAPKHPNTNARPLSDSTFLSWPEESSCLFAEAPIRPTAWFHARVCRQCRLMRLDDGFAEGSAGQFRTTRWTLVLVSAQNQGQAAQVALAELCQIYWYPLYAFARRRGHSPDDSQDLTQGFFLDLLEHRALSRVDRLKGKF